MRRVLPLITRHEAVGERLHEAHERVFLCVREAQPPHALRLAKSLLRQGQTASYDTLMEMSAAAQAISHLTEDHMEGVDSILEKRPAVFSGR